MFCLRFGTKIMTLVSENQDFGEREPKSETTDRYPDLCDVFVGQFILVGFKNRAGVGHFGYTDFGRFSWHVNLFSKKRQSTYRSRSLVSDFGPNFPGNCSPAG